MSTSEPWVPPPDNVQEDLGTVVIPPSASIAVSVEPPTGNTAMNVEIDMQVHLLTDAL